MDYLSFDNYEDFKRSVRAMESLTKEENIELIRAYREGNLGLKNFIVEGNLSLVIWEVDKIKRPLTSLAKMDLVNEAIFGLFSAIENYDASGGAFSSYATTCIRFTLKSAIRKLDSTVYRPNSFWNDLNKYRQYIADIVKKGDSIPDDEKIKEDLDITDETLYCIKNNYVFDTMSTATPIGDEEDGTTIEDTLSSPSSDTEELEENIANYSLIAFLKCNVSRLDYYLIYYRLFADIPKQFTEFSKELGRNAVMCNYAYKAALKNLRQYVGEDKNFAGFLSPEDQFLVDHNLFRLKPISPIDVMKYLFVRDELSQDEKKLYQEKLFSNEIYSINRLARRWGKTVEDIREIESSQERKCSKAFTDDAELFQTFAKNIIETFREKIMGIDLNMDVSEFKRDYRFTSKKWATRTYEDVLEMATKVGVEIDEYTDSKLKSYFGKTGRATVPKSLLNEKINLLIKGFYGEDDIVASKLYKAFCQNRDKFTPYQALSVEYLFGKISKRKLLEKCPDFDFKHMSSGIDEKLYKYYFGLESYKWSRFGRSEYLQVRSKCLDNLSEEDVFVLDNLFGVGCEVKNTEFFANYFKCNNPSGYVGNIKQRAISLYLGVSSYSQLDLAVYKDYLSMNPLDLGEKNNRVLEMYLKENKSYDEIAVELGLTGKKVATIITNCLWRIDYSRFEIFFEPNIPKEVLFEELKAMNIDEEQYAVLSRCIEGAFVDVAIKGTNLSAKKIASLLTELKNRCKKKMVKGVEVTREDVERELARSPIETLLSDKEKDVLARAYDVKSEGNAEERTFTIKEIGAKLGLNETDVGYYKNNGITKIAERKLGLARALYDFITRDEISSILEDPHVPLNSKEKDLLSSLYGAGRPACTLEEYCDTNGENLRAVRGRLYKAVVSVRRYERGEIKGQVSYEVDVEPYIKYFTQSDREVLVELYKEEKTFNEIAAKRGLNYSNIIYIIQRLRLYLKYLQEGGKPGLDFDYFYANVERDDIPFYGNKALALELFVLYYEKGWSLDKLQEAYPNINEKSIHRMINLLAIAVAKKSKGIKRVPDYSYEEVRAHYLKYNGDMTLAQKEVYYRYFKTHDKYIVSTKRVTPLSIILDIAKKREDYIDIDSLDKEEIRSIIRRYREKLSQAEIFTLYKRFGFKPSEYMKGRDIIDVLDFLENLDRLFEVENNGEKSLEMSLQK